MGIEEMILEAINAQPSVGNIGVLISEDVHKALGEELRAKGRDAEGGERSKLRGVHYSVVPDLPEPGFRVGLLNEIIEEARKLLGSAHAHVTR